MRNVVLVTTMWDTVHSETGAKYESELVSNDNLFKPIIDNGGHMFRHDGTLLSAQAILRRILLNHPEHARIEQEPDFFQFNKEFDELLEEVVSSHDAELERVRQKMVEALAAKDAEVAQQLEGMRNALLDALKESKRDRQWLLREHAREMQAMQAKLKEVEAVRDGLQYCVGKLWGELMTEAKQSNQKRLELLHNLPWRVAATWAAAFAAVLAAHSAYKRFTECVCPPPPESLLQRVSRFVFELQDPILFMLRLPDIGVQYTQDFISAFIAYVTGLVFSFLLMIVKGPETAITFCITALL